MFELRAESRQGGDRQRSNEDNIVFGGLDSDRNTQDKEFKKAQGKSNQTDEKGSVDAKGLNTVNKNFGIAGNIIANNLLDNEEDPWNTGRVVDRDSKKRSEEEMMKNYNTVDLRTKKANREGQDADGNERGTVDAKL